MYTPTKHQDDARTRAFTYQPPQPNQPERYTRLRAAAKQLSDLFDCNCPPSRELSLAQTKLEEAIMWANAAIARNEPAQEASTS